MGWIKTADQYFTGEHMELVPVGVRYILNTVIDELAKNTSRRFSYAETGFLQRWLDTAKPEQVALFKKLVDDGQIELIGGGWVQPDEAASHYVDLIDQYTLGLRILNETFSACGRPRVAWQIDPFGHSREHANLVALMGYEALFFARMHYLEHEQRIKDKSLEFIWNASNELKTNILTGGFYTGTYAPPSGFCFDALCGDDPIIDNPKLDGYNVDVKADKFVDMVKEQASHQRHRHVMIMMGGDFQYTNANMWFTNLDALVAAVNKKSNDSKVHVFYSTPSCYVRAVTQSGPHLPQKTDDFFPYASGNHSYWTGYFTSKPALKGFIRKSSALLQLSRQLSTMAFSSNQSSNEENVLERASALSQHHDAVTGTSKENVTRDYEKRLSIGWDNVEAQIGRAFAKLARKTNQSSLPKLQFCRLINETVCDASSTKKTLAVTVFNPNSQPLNSIVRVPYQLNSATVRNGSNGLLDHRLTKSFVLAGQLNTSQSAPYELVFPVSVAPLGFSTYFVSRGTSPGNLASNKNAVLKPFKVRGNDTTSIRNELIQLTFGANGFLSTYYDVRQNKTYELRQEFLYYAGMGSKQNGTRTEATGAYIFRPNGTQPLPTSSKIQLEVISNGIVQEVRQRINPWISQVIRLVPNKSYVEFDYIVGPLPKEVKDPVAKEVITRYTLKGLKNGGTFQTDANGRQLIERKLKTAPCYTYEDTEPVSANYFPVNSRIIASDAEKQLTILTDRSQGGTSLSDGQLDIMLHRRAFADDGWGVEEPLDEPGEDGRGLVVRGRHWLLLNSPPDSAARQHRTLAFELFHEPVLGFTSIESIDDYRSKFRTEFTALTETLPAHIHVLTLKVLEPGVVLLRLEHIFQNGEDKMLSQPITVDLRKLFTRLDILSVDELSLAANSLAGWTYRRPPPTNQTMRLLRREANEDEITIKLKPMEIKTLRLSVRERP
ncbi:AMAN-1 protein [Aphelenchoides avenae]|nr:AMAN-1 protein [Aphelenchus avenae]